MLERGQTSVSLWASPGPAARGEGRRAVGRIMIVVVAVVLAACTAGGAASSSAGGAAPSSAAAASSAALASPSAVPSPTASPSSAGRGVTLVRSITGLGGCTVTSYKDETSKTSLVMTEHFTCVSAMTDPRVSGTTELDIVTTFEPPSSKAGRFVATGTLTNAGGSWTGRSYGAVVVWPDNPAGAPLNTGVDYWTGHGGYEGLTYKDLIAGDDDNVDTVGYILEHP